MIVYLRCSLLFEDVRLRKYVESCKNNDVSYSIISWDREGIGNYSKEEIVFKVKASYGRLWRNLIYKIWWQFFLLAKLILINKRIKVVHACDFDTMLPAVIYCYFTKKKLIYDVYDAISTPKPKTYFKKIIRFLDLLFIDRCNVLILADEARITQMGITNAEEIDKVFVVENVPNLTHLPNEELRDNSKVKISYVGVLDRNRGIESLLKFIVQHDNYVLDIAGVGTLTDFVINYSKKSSRINYHGFVEYSYGIKLMYNSDLIIGMYYPVTLNQQYASPNKFYESLFLGKPLLTSKGTLVGRKVLEFNTGYVVDNDFSSLEECILGIDLNDKTYLEKGNCAKILWKEKYQTYFKNRLCIDYINLIKNNS